MSQENRESLGSDAKRRGTEKGYDLFEVASVVQKSIRRGDEDAAMFFSVELFNSGFGEYLWKRLRIISSEDVGLAEPNISANVQALYEMYQEQKKKKDQKNAPERLFLTHAVLMLCRAKKSRLVDWTLIQYWDSHDEERREIPDYAYDKHNRKGRQLGRGWEHFFDEGSRLENHTPLEQEEARKEGCRRVVNKGRRTGVAKTAVPLSLFS